MGGVNFLPPPPGNLGPEGGSLVGVVLDI